MTAMITVSIWHNVLEASPYYHRRGGGGRVWGFPRDYGSRLSRAFDDCKVISCPNPRIIVRTRNVSCYRNRDTPLPVLFPRRSAIPRLS